jgi:hypothetical protein
MGNVGAIEMTAYMTTEEGERARLPEARPTLGA